MREQREPWLTLPAKESGSKDSPRLDARFRTHVVAVQRASASPAESLARPPSRPVPGPREPEIAVPPPPAGAAPTPAAIERAAAAAAISQRSATRLELRSAHPPVVAVPPPPAPKTVETRAAVAAAISLDDLPPVSSPDWAVKVGEAAKMVDVVVVFYTAAYRGSEMFEFAFRTVVNEVLPQAGRPYTVYRFSLDAEPGFVPEMATSLGLPADNPVTAAGFAWSGPGRRLFLLGDHALESPAVFQRALRRTLTGRPAELPRASAARRPPAASAERPRGGAVRPWSGRVLAILAWCLFGTAALGAVAVGVAPQWTSSLLHPTSVPGPAADNQSPPANTQLGATSPAVGPDNTASASPAAPAQAQTKPAKPVKHARRKHTPWLSLNPTYWGLPSDGRTR